MTAVPQPSGEVTLVFSDIEGSTRLLAELGTDAYRDALAEHRRIVREAYARYAGYEVDYEGDAFFYAFSSASDAVGAVSEAMTGLDEGPISIRVGLHTGEPVLDPPKYVGMDVHFAARVMSSAHGGQVVLSEATADRVDVQLLDLGEHRLKDISEAVPLYQLGDARFPPLKTISNTNLPRPASSFLGREAELEEVMSRLEAGARVLTLTGPGGTGKTRLALEAAAARVGEHKAGVFWIGLASLRDPALVLETIAQTLGAKGDLAEHIGERELLLLLDNLEQVIEAAPELSSLLQACPNLTVLVTSRELLRIQGEVEYAVPPLATTEAVSLFCERSRIEPSEEISELCARLDSLPLAVELAAARARALSPAQILERLSQRLDLLQGGRDAEPRQQTLRATIEWSYELLTLDERQLFARLSVFQGGCTLEAAEEVAEAHLDTLQQIVEKSLLRFTDERYWMLETIREYAGERLERAGAEAEMRRRHAGWMTRVVESNAGAPGAELDNLRGALGWTRDAGAAELELRLANATRRFWANAGHVREGLEWLHGAAERGPADMVEQRAMVLTTATFCAIRLGYISRALEIAEAQLGLSRSVGGSALVAGLGALASVLEQAGEAQRSLELFNEAVDLARAEGSPSVLAASLFNSAGPHFTQGNYERALQVYLEALSVFRVCDDAQGEAHASVAIGDCLFRLDRKDEGHEYVRRGLLRLDALGLPRLVAETLLSFAEFARFEAQWQRAATLLGAHEAIMDDVSEVREPTADGTYGDIHASCRLQLGAQATAAAIERGLRMTRHEAVEYALASID